MTVRWTHQEPRREESRSETVARRGWRIRSKANKFKAFPRGGRWVFQRKTRMRGCLKCITFLRSILRIDPTVRGRKRVHIKNGMSRTPSPTGAQTVCVRNQREDEGILPYGRHSALFPYSLLHIPSNRRGRCPHRPANVHAEQTVEKVNRPYGCADKIGLLTFTCIYMYAGLYFTILFRRRSRPSGQNSPQCYSKAR